MSADTAPGYLALWNGLRDGSLAWLDFESRFRALASLTYLTIDTTPACDLRCEGCYYHPDIPVRGPRLDESAFVHATGTAIDELGTRVVVLAGKEPLLDAPRAWRLVESFSGLPSRGRVQVGIVTNGRQLEREWTRLEALDREGGLDFVDVSFDSGFAREHDAVRGVPGTFDRAFGALARMARELSYVRVGSACVLRPGNGPGLLELLRRTAGLEVAHWIAPLQPAPFACAVAPPTHEIGHFIDQVRDLLDRELAGAGADVTVSIPGVHVHDLVDAGTLRLDGVEEDERGQLFVSEERARNRLSVHLAVFPDNGWRQVRILSDGTFLSHLHFVQTPTPQRFAIGNLAASSIVELWRAALGPDRLAAQLLASRAHHECRERECWGTCLGGWTVSENSFLTGQRLDRQPALCQRPRLRPVVTAPPLASEVS